MSGWTSTLGALAQHALSMGSIRVALVAAALSLSLASPATAQSDDGAPGQPAAPSKTAVGVPTVKAVPSVEKLAAGRGQSTELSQIVEGLDAKFSVALQNSRKFDVLAHARLSAILKEQGIGESGGYDPSDPKRPQWGKLKGMAYLAIVQINDYQNVVQKADFGAIGKGATKRIARISATCEIYDTTKGSMLEAVNATFEEFDAKDNPGFVTFQQGGDLTEAVVNLIADTLAKKLAQRFTDVIFPAKVTSVVEGIVNINRGDGTDIAKGEIWEVFLQGAAQIDPDTGENLGAEEIPVGFVKIESVLPKFSKAAICSGDRGIAKGCIVRRTERKDCGTLEGAARMIQSTPQDGGAAPPLPRPGGASPRETPSSTPAAPPAAAAPVRNADAGSKEQRSVAVIVRSRDPQVREDQIMVLEDYVFSGLDGTSLAPISREDTLNAVSSFVSDGPNAGTNSIPDSKKLDKILSDNTSATALAQTMGADYLLIASITALVPDTRDFEDRERGIRTKVETLKLDVSYRILERASGRAIAQATVEASDSVRQSPESTVRRDMLPGLLRQCGAKLAAVVKNACDKGRLAKPEDRVMVPFEISAGTSDFAVPEIVKDANGNLVVSAGRFRLEPTDFIVDLNGVYAGTTPTTIRAPQGACRLKVSRDDYENLRTVHPSRAEHGSGARRDEDDRRRPPSRR